MSQFGGYSGRIAHYDLTKQGVMDLKWNEEEFLPFIGGRGLAAFLLHKLLPPGTNPLSPENLLIFAVGPFVGTKVPFSSRWSVAAKSPLTGITGSGNGGGNFGPSLKWAGLDALIISGKATHPSYLFIDNGEFHLRPADLLWGKSPEEVSLTIRSDIGASAGDPHVGIAAIGRAGEEGISLSVILSDDHSAGRGGLGAVMGSKNLKAVVIRGSRKVEVFDPSALNRKAREMTDDLMGQKQYARFIKYGSMSALRDRYGVLGGFLTFNGQKGSCPHLDHIDGDAMYPYLWPSESCFGCPMPCTHYFTVEEGKYGPVRGKGCPGSDQSGLWGSVWYDRYRGHPEGPCPDQPSWPGPHLRPGRDRFCHGVLSARHYRQGDHGRGGSFVGQCESCRSGVDRAHGTE